ncbi:MAG TPA: tetratricopeptide repeat protein [Rhizomicrobium sp.]|jgi:Flp pilus assembly protein TadD
MSSPERTHDALLGAALADHRAGRLTAAEDAYRAVIAACPGDAGGNHHLGVLLIQTGRVDEGLSRLKSALEANGGEPLYYFSLAKGLLAAGDPAQAGAVLKQAMQRGLADRRFDALKTGIRKKATAACRAALKDLPGDAARMDNLGSALLMEGKTEEAIACYRQALAQAPDFAHAHFHLGAVLSQNDRVAEGFEHYMRHAVLMHDGKGVSSADDPPFKKRHDAAQRDYIGDGGFHLADGERLSSPAVNPGNATPQLLEAWQRSRPQMVVVDGFLTQPALAKLRAFCAGSTVWRKIYPAEYLGAAPEDGFAAPLLAQIVEETQAVFGPILAGEPFRYLGAFKYDSEVSAGTNTHADNSNVNVNLYITDDDANLDPKNGGLEIWDAAAPDIQTMRRLNGSEEMVQHFLERSEARRLTVPHRANRAVIFKSTQFHKTDSFRFKTDYLFQRINISMLFGEFSTEE